MKKTRVLAAVVALMMILTPVIAKAETNMFGWEKPEAPLEFSVFYFYDNWAPEEEAKAGIENMKAYLLENFNIKIDIITTDASASERANLMLASNDYPDVIQNMDTETRVKFVDQGKAVEMTPYLETVAPNVAPFMGDLYGMYLDDAEKLYYVPTGFGALFELPDYSAHIRYDEWLEIGSPKIETPDDYYNAIMAVLEKNPTTPAGEQRYSMSFSDQGNVPNNLTGYWGLKKGWKIADDDTFTYWTDTDEGKAMSQYFNKFWRSGTMDPDAFINKWEDWRTKFSNKRIVGAVSGWWVGYNAGHEIWMLTDPDWTENMRTIQVGFKAPEAEAAYVTGKNRLGGNWTIITDKAKDPEGIMKWIDFQTTTPGRALVNWGIPNGVPTFKDPTKTLQMWTLTNPDDWKFDETAKEQFVTETWDYPAEGILGANQGTFQLFNKYDRWEDGEHCIWGNQMWYSENKWKTIMMENMEGSIYDATAMAIVQKPDEIALIETAVTDAWKQGWPLVVQAETDDDFEAAWSSLQDAVKMADIDTLAQFMSDNYKTNSEKLGTN